jgi:hypothetical protein
VRPEVWGKQILTTHRPHDGGSKVLWNDGKFLPDYTALQPRRQPPLYQPPWEPQILPGISFIFPWFLFICVLMIWRFYVQIWLQTGNFICKKHTLEVYLFHKAYQLLIQSMNGYVSPWKTCFQDLASLMRCPESLSFNHRSHVSAWTQRSSISLRRSNFAVNWPYINFIVGSNCYFWLVIWDEHQKSWFT